VPSSSRFDGGISFIYFFIFLIIFSRPPDHAWEFLYKKGATVTLSQKERDGYDTMKEFNDPIHPCTTGIHYFETKEGALKLAAFWQNIHSIP
jgi:hypothetical protein